MDWKCQRWAIIDKKTGKEIGTLGWYSNSTKEEVKRHAEKGGIVFEKDEEIKIVEEY